MQPILTIALRAAQSAADKLNYTVGNISQLTAEGATREDVFDKAIEDAAWRARKAIRAAHPRHHIESVQIGMEESRDWDGQSAWLIDVAAGETNLRNGYPGTLVSVALYTKGKIDCVALVNPLTEEFATASRGRGVQFNDRRCRVEYSPLAKAVVGIETKSAELLGHWLEQSGQIRVTGCDLMNFLYLAAGKLHVSVAQNMSPADFASAMLLVQEAGALTGDSKGNPVKAEHGELMAAAPKLFKQLMAAR